MKKEIDINKIKYHPAFWWNLLLFWLAQKGIIGAKTINRFGWRIK